MRLILSTALTFFLCANLFADGSVVEHLQHVSVTVQTGNGQGSGTLKTRVDDKGVTHSFVLTAAHVVDGLRATRTVVDPKTGTPRVIVEFKDASITQFLQENGRKVGQVSMDAKVVKYSNSDSGDDIAILKIRKTNFVSKEQTVSFYLEDKIPSVGTEVYHCGSLLGEMGSNSLTTGIVSQTGRLINGTVYDQSTATAFPGSSGGIICLKSDGRYVGMLVRGAGENFNLYVPIRRIQAWVKKNKLDFVLDDNVPMPSEEELDKIPVEDIGTSFNESK